MKKVFLFLPVILLAACAGNPPEWWNPSGRYSQTAAQGAAAERSKQVVKEEVMDPLPDNSYEEETLEPLPEEEDTPAVEPVTEPALDGGNDLPVPSVLE